MPAKPVFICLLSFWALSIIGSPVAWLYQSRDNIAISLNNAEEESGKTVKVDPLEEKLILYGSLGPENDWLTGNRELPFKDQVVASDFFGEIVLPPPECPLLA